jgi:hypothetical protein
MIKIVALATMLAVLGCAAPSERAEPAKDQQSSGALSEEDRLPKDVQPRPVRPTCPPGMAGSC